MKDKDFELDFEALLSEVVYGHGFLHYGYFPDGPPETPSAEAFGRAQQAYFDLLAATIPEGTKTILDVGSGTGSNAAALTKLGYALECLCPSEQLNEMARRKLPKTSTVHTTKFEDFETDKRFDLCIFAESFHYIDLASALGQIARYSKNGAVIFDYFRRPGAVSATDGTRGTHADFLAEVERQGKLKVVHDEDLTEAIQPTFYIFDHIKNVHLAPFAARFREEFRRTNPVKSFLLERVLRKVLKRIERPSNREEVFAARNEYHLIRLVPA